MKNLALFLLITSCAADISAQQPADDGTTHPGSQRDAPAAADHAAMDHRGESGMGFSQTATTHHFFLNSRGGIIQVESRDPLDAPTRAEIRMHLAHISSAFQRGDFAIPMFVHDTVPPGVAELQRLKTHIRYSFSATPNGGRVIITSTNPKALVAIHEFLRFQIEEHHTGDPVTSE